MIINIIIISTMTTVDNGKGKNKLKEEETENSLLLHIKEK